MPQGRVKRRVLCVFRDCASQRGDSGRLRVSIFAYRYRKPLQGQVVGTGITTVRHGFGKTRRQVQTSVGRAWYPESKIVSLFGYNESKVSVKCVLQQYNNGNFFVFVWYLQHVGTYNMYHGRYQVGSYQTHTLLHDVLLCT